MSTRRKRSAASAGTHHDIAATPVKIAKLTNGSAVDSKGKQKAVELSRPSVRSLVTSTSPLPYGPAPESSDVAKAWLEEHGDSLGHFINGGWVKPEGRKTYDTINPATGEKLASTIQGVQEDADLAVSSARKAYDSWSTLPGHVRARHMYSIARHVQKHARLISVIESMDNGKSIRESRDLDIPLVARHFYHHAGWAQLMEDEMKGWAPIGVVCAIVPWNFPLMLLTWKVCPALAMGNTVVLKPATFTRLSALLFAEICAEAGLPPGVFYVVTGPGSFGQMIATHPGVDKIGFTGSTQVRAVKHVLDALKPYLIENGGVIKAEHITFVEGRGNLLLEYCPEGATSTVTFIGSHLDVVPANPETWDRNPFKLQIEGDKLYGRGTTDCLGHVALITELFIQLAEKKPQLKYSVHAVFIASEENNSIQGVGVEKLLEVGKLDKLKNGPLFWVDSADTNPCMGTATAMMWTLRVEGRLFHSGLPHKGINSLELAMEAIKYMQTNFYKDFPAHKDEERYKFSTPSTMKPTQVKCSEGSVNQLPPWTEIQGDIRLTPFYDAETCLEKVKGYAESINNDPAQLDTRGPCSKYELDIAEGKFKGKIKFILEGGILRGIACNLDSVGFKRLDEATRDVVGDSKPYSICGSLPLVGDLQKAGFDVQVCGYGHSSVYHGDNEYCTLSVMKTALKILSCLLDKFN